MSFAHRFDFNLAPSHFTDEGQQCFTYSQGEMQIHSTVEVSESNTLSGMGHKAGENVVLSYYVQNPRRRPSSQGVLLYNIQKIRRGKALSPAARVFFYLHTSRTAV